MGGEASGGRPDGLVRGKQSGAGDRACTVEREGIVPAETVDSLLLERYWFNLYRLTLAG